MKCLVWSVALYATETWTLMQTDRRLEAFDIWIRRRMTKISWLDKVTNKEVLRRVNEDRQILTNSSGNPNTVDLLIKSLTLVV